MNSVSLYEYLKMKMKMKAKLFGHAQLHKGRMKENNPGIDTAQPPKRLDRRLALPEKIRKIFTDSILNTFCIMQ